jgi:hypothetical protein
MLPAKREEELKIHNMKKYSLVTFQLFIIISQLAAQTNDSTFQHDRSKKESPVSTFGYYFSVGAGAALISPMAGAEVNGSCSFAYKSHIISLSGMRSGTLLNGGSENENWFNFSSYGILAGEALRMRHWLLSASAGIGNSDVKYHKVIHANHEYFDYSHRGVSMPAEIKLFFLASHFGIGFQISTDLTAKYAPTTITMNMVFGTWRKPKE